MAIQFNPNLGVYVDTDTMLKIEPVSSVEMPKGKEHLVPFAHPPSSTTPPLLPNTPIKVKRHSNEDVGGFNVIKLAKARLKVLKMEIKRLRVLEVEQKQLEKLLSAAEDKPLAVVHDISKKQRIK